MTLDYFENKKLYFVHMMDGNVTAVNYRIMIEFTDKGLYCPAGGFHIDPWKPVERAVITHAHSDHARAGSSSYLCHRLTVPLLELRLGPGIYQGVEWGNRSG